MPALDSHFGREQAGELRRQNRRWGEAYSQAAVQTNPAQKEYLSTVLKLAVELYLAQIPGVLAARNFRVGSCQLEPEPFHRGGFGLIYRARNQAGRQYVFKFSADPGLLLGNPASQVAESAHQAAFYHDNICALKETGKVDGYFYTVMDFIDGVNLVRFCQNHHLNLAQRCQLFIQLCHAVAHMHCKGKIHGDLKPGNILVRYQEGGHFELKLLDFGTAQDLAESRPVEALSPGYAAPEQSAGKALAIAADIYALGVILYQLFTFRAFGQEVQAAVGQHVMKPCPGPGVLEPAVLKRHIMANGLHIGKHHARELAAILEKALALEPESRYLQVDAVVMEVNRLLVCKPLQAKSGRAFYSATLFLRRNSRWFWLAVLLVLSLAGLGPALWQQKGLLQARSAVAALEQKADTLASQVSHNPLASLAGLLETASDSLIRFGHVHPQVRYSLAVSLESARETSRFNHGRPASFLAMSPDERRFAVGNRESVSFYNREGVPLGKALSPPDGSLLDLTAMAFGPQGRFFATGSGELGGGLIRLWTQTGQLATTPFGGGNGRVFALVFHPFRDVFACATADGMIRLWDFQGRQIMPPLQNAHAKTEWLSFGKSGEVLFCVGTRRSQWQPASFSAGQARGSALVSYSFKDTLAGAQIIDLQEQIRVLALNGARTMLAAGTADGKIWIWKVQGRDLLRTAIISTDHRDGVTALCWAGRGQILSAGAAHRLRLWSLDRHPLTPLLSGHNRMVIGLAGSLSGTWALSIDQSGLAITWDLANFLVSEKRLSLPLEMAGLTTPLENAVFVPERDLLVFSAGPFWGIAHYGGPAVVLNGPRQLSDPIRALAVDGRDGRIALAYGRKYQPSVIRLASLNDKLSKPLDIETGLPVHVLTILAEEERLLAGGGSLLALRPRHGLQAWTFHGKLLKRWATDYPLTALGIQAGERCFAAAESSALHVGNLQAFPARSLPLAALQAGKQITAITHLGDGDRWAVACLRPVLANSGSHQGTQALIALLGPDGRIATEINLGKNALVSHLAALPKGVGFVAAVNSRKPGGAATIGTWDSSGTALLPPLKGHRSAIVALAANGAGQLLSVDANGVLLRWETGFGALKNLANQRLADYHRSHQVEAMMQQAQQALDRGLAHRALQIWTQIIEIHPRPAIALLARSRLHAQMGAWPGSVADAARALSHEPDLGGALFQRGIARFHLADYAGTIRDMTALLRHGGQGLRQVGKPSGRISDRNFVRKSRPFPANYWRGVALLRQSQIPLAINDLIKAENHPDSPGNVHQFKTLAQIKLGLTPNPREMAQWSLLAPSSSSQVDMDSADLSSEEARLLHKLLTGKGKGI